MPLYIVKYTPIGLNEFRMGRFGHHVYAIRYTTRNFFISVASLINGFKKINYPDLMESCNIYRSTMNI